MEKQIINCMITEQEYTRIKELKKVFSVKTMSDVFEPALAYVASNKNIEVKTPVRDGTAKWKRMCFIFKPEIIVLIEGYSLANFRDMTNTIRFLINASYENITNGKK